MRRYSATIILVSVLTYCIIMVLPLEVSSNPIITTGEGIETGGLFMTDSVSMPEAEVHIVLDPLDTKTFELRSTFNFISDTNQTSLTAFAYPNGWGSATEFEIKQNQELVSFEKLTFGQLIDKYNETTGDVDSTDITDWGWIEDHNFATFNLTFIENTPKLLEVLAVSSIGFEAKSGYMSYCGFSYCVGSAYSWDGTTHEIITMEVKGVQNQLSRIGDDAINWTFREFWPETGLSETWNQTWATAIWDLTIEGNDFEITHVGFYGIYTQSLDPNGHIVPLPFNQDLFIVPIIGVIGVVIVGIYFAKRRFWPE